MKKMALVLVAATAASPVFAQENGAFGSLFRLSGGLVGPTLPLVPHAVVNPQAVPQWTNTVDFQCVTVSQDEKATAACLKKAGITVRAATAGSKVAVVDNQDVYGGKAAAPAGG